MKILLSWLAELVPGLPSDAGAVADALVRAGFEVEAAVGLGRDLTGVVVARVDAIDVVAAKKKNVRLCRVSTADSGNDMGRSAATRGRIHKDAQGDLPGIARTFPSSPAGSPDSPESADFPEASRQVICGASNFGVGDKVALALPGAVLPGGFEISARKTYGHLSEGMICSESELGLGGDAAGILVLPPQAPLGADLAEVLGIADDLFELKVNPDRGYALSARGLAREMATAFGLPFTDPGAPGTGPGAGSGAGTATGSAEGGGTGPAAVPGHPVVIDDTAGCTRYVARVVTGVDPAAATPFTWRRRLASCGMRPISVPVDVTNAVMLTLGQPLHAFDAAKLSGPIVVRRARPGEHLVTLDGVDRTLHPEDLVIADDSGAIALAGVMGGAATEISAGTTDILIEAAHFDPISIARTARRHRLPSEASRRFERGVDPALAPVAAQAAVRMLTELAGARPAAGVTDVDARPAPVTIAFPLSEPERLAGRPYSADAVVGRLAGVGCRVDAAPAGGAPAQGTPTGTGAARETVPAPGVTTAEESVPAQREPAGGEPAGTGTGSPADGVPGLRDAGRGDAGRGDAGRGGAGGVVTVTPPSWRPDLTRPADLVEEVLRLEGYDTIPVTLPELPAGRGLTEAQRMRRGVGRALAHDGFSEVLTVPFVAGDVADRLGLGEGDRRRAAARISNPIAEDAAYLRTSLLPGLFAAAVRNIGRGQADLALYEIGTVFQEPLHALVPVPVPPVDDRPGDAQVEALNRLLPEQPTYAAALLTGRREPAGWWGDGRAADWGDAVAAAHTVARALGVELQVAPAGTAPWHPGRCAALSIPGGDGGSGGAAGTGSAGGAGSGGGGGLLVGHAGELHPRVLAAFDLPPRTVAMELDLGALVAAAVARPPVVAPVPSAYPPADRDVALVVGADVPVARVSQALRSGAGELLESLTLFDVFEGAQVGPGRRSLAFGMRLRAADHTLTAQEANAVRDAAVAEATRVTGAALRT